MLGLMQNLPLMISSLIRHADRNHGDTEIVSRETAGGLHRYTYRDAHRRARQLARALLAQGVKPADRVATLAWNTHRHFELYYGVSGIGAILNTINPRLFPEQIGYIVNHADDGLVFFDLTFLPLVEGLAPHCKGVRSWVALTDRTRLPASTLSEMPHSSASIGESEVVSVSIANSSALRSFATTSSSSFFVFTQR